MVQEPSVANLWMRMEHLYNESTCRYSCTVGACPVQAQRAVVARKSEGSPALLSNHRAIALFSGQGHKKNTNNDTNDSHSSNRNT